MILLNASWDSFLQLLLVLIIFIFVLVLTVLTTRWIGSYQKTQMTGKNMQIIETMRMGNNKYIALVSVGDNYLVIGVGKDEIHELGHFSKEELSIIADSASPEGIKEGFQSILEKFKHEER